MLPSQGPVIRLRAEVPLSDQFIYSVLVSTLVTQEYCAAVRTIHIYVIGEFT